jgi:hypothetical protein
MSKTDGGPAFPVECSFTKGEVFAGMQTGNNTGWVTGVSVRDYFASHADQPGTNEAYQMAGCPEHVIPPDERIPYPRPAEDKRIPVADWWSGLPLDEKYRLYAALRFKIADAMLAARSTE